MLALMIDCSRLVERHSYYFRLLDFMAAWGYKALVLHFSDDNGLSISLPGFADIAQRYAFSPAEVKRLVAHARGKGIEVIPELETFGHTRFLTDHPKYAHLYAGEKKREISFNALDPLDPESLVVIKRLMKATASLFPSPCLHIGCDEVNLADYCRQEGLDEKQVWIEHVNRVIKLAREMGKVPLLWADREQVNPDFARVLDGQCDKRAVAVFWDYSPKVSGKRVGQLKRAGFRRVWVAPAAAASQYRLLPPSSALKNIDRMAGFSKRHGANGFLLTVWEPYRYVQGAAYYGIAYAAEAARAGGRPDRQAFHRRFARQVFGTSLEPALEKALKLWPLMEINWDASQRLGGAQRRLSDDTWPVLEKARAAGPKLLALAEGYQPKKNQDIWRAMLVAARAAWVFAEHLLLARGPAERDRVRELKQAVKRSLRELAEEWDRGRFPDDPHKWKPAFPNKGACYVLPMMRRVARYWREGKGP